jgi:hypothetical protein
MWDGQSEALENTDKVARPTKAVSSSEHYVFHQMVALLHIVPESIRHTAAHLHLFQDVLYRTSMTAKEPSTKVYGKECTRAQRFSLKKQSSFPEQ